MHCRLFLFHKCAGRRPRFSAAILLVSLYGTPARSASLFTDAGASVSISRVGTVTSLDPADGSTNPFAPSTASASLSEPDGSTLSVVANASAAAGYGDLLGHVDFFANTTTWSSDRNS